MVRIVINTVYWTILRNTALLGLGDRRDPLWELGQEPVVDPAKVSDDCFPAMESPSAARVHVSLWLDGGQPQLFAGDQTQGVSMEEPRYYSVCWNILSGACLVPQLLLFAGTA